MWERSLDQFIYLFLGIFRSPNLFFKNKFLYKEGEIFCTCLQNIWSMTNSKIIVNLYTIKFFSNINDHTLDIAKFRSELNRVALELYHYRKITAPDQTIPNTMKLILIALLPQKKFLWSDSYPWFSFRPHHTKELSSFIYVSPPLRSKGNFIIQIPFKYIKL